MSIDTQNKLRYCPLCDGFFTLKHSCFNPIALADHLEIIANLKQMRSLDQNAIEAKDHKIVMLEQANAKLEAAYDEAIGALVSLKAKIEHISKKGGIK
jgi:hypothetical protein